MLVFALEQDTTYGSIIHSSVNSLADTLAPPHALDVLLVQPQLGAEHEGVHAPAGVPAHCAVPLWPPLGLLCSAASWFLMCSVPTCAATLQKSLGAIPRSRFTGLFED